MTSTMFDGNSGSAPASISACITPTWFAAAAKIRGVCPQAFSLTLTCAPAKSREVTVSISPDAEARCKAVEPELAVFIFGSMPAVNKIFITLALPFLAAKCNGLYCPILVPAIGLAPA